MKKKPKIILIFLLALFALILIFISVLGSLLLSSKPVGYELDKVDFSALNSANSKIQNEFNYLTGPQQKTDMPRTITFSAAELNALLAMSVTGANTFKSGKSVFSDLYVFYDKGKFYFDASKKIGFYTPFGRYINLNCKFTFKLKNRAIDFKILYLKAGNIVLPKIIIDYLVNKKIDTIYSVPAIQRLLDTVKEISSYSDKVVIVYYPEVLSRELNSFLKGRVKLQ